MKIRIVDSNYTDFFENIIKNKIIYPKKNPCFNLSFSKYYNNQYLFCVRNVILYDQLIKNINLYPGIRKYSKNNESNMHNNNDLSNIFIWEWKNYYQTYIFFVGDLNIKTLEIKINKDIMPYTLISPMYTYKVPDYLNKLRPNTHAVPMEDFRLYFHNNIMYIYDSLINTISIMALYKNKLILNKRYTGICEMKYIVKTDVKTENYEKVFEKNWSLYDVKKKNKDDIEFKFIHDYEIDGLYGVSYFTKNNNCKKKLLVSYSKNTFPINSKFIRFSVGTTCIDIKENLYLGIGHIKIKYNYLKSEINDINTNIEKHYINIARKINVHLKKKYGKIYRPHRWIIYMGYFFLYDKKNNKFHISDLFLPLPDYKYIFSLSFPMSLQKINKNIVISSGLGDYTNILYSMDEKNILNKTIHDINNIDLTKLKIFSIENDQKDFVEINY
jgi:hypothetical protein